MLQYTVVWDYGWYGRRRWCVAGKEKLLGFNKFANGFLAGFGGGSPRDAREGGFLGGAPAPPPTGGAVPGRECSPGGFGAAAPPTEV